MSFLSTHILDTANGSPAEGLTVHLFSGEQKIASGTTDSDGRISDLGPDQLETGDYTLVFEIGDYYPRTSFWNSVSLTVSLVQETGHYHIPLLLSPYSISSYRGS
ncbi:hydroxyisourate hydrolase [Rothia aerolata]|uniref:5-hydroxyisourate hydrolase n=1 Tax=Rothia aerolata TaxID=1812262 RepID=A0A917IVI6_9MICC|nr:hydroxyisourate hydrolase [Rothia aerolata]GGH65791.1 5-hydroxyisourate hydrolase [Rothia aerolata]